MLKIRASQAFKLMTEPKLKADKEAGRLSETAKTYIRELWLFEKYGYKEPVVTDIILKGFFCEQDSMTLVQNVLKGELRSKNLKRFENDYVTGIPDVILSDVIEDVKSSWSIKTFMESELEKQYYYQGQCYMALTGINKYRLIYCLNSTPEHLVTNERQKYYYKFQCDEENSMLKDIYKQIERNHEYNNIPESDRVKIFSFDFNAVEYAKLCDQVIKARNYYDSLTLNSNKWESS